LRNEYFDWNSESEEALKEYVNKGGLTWAQIGGRLTAAYGHAISGLACRAKYERLVKAETSEQKQSRREGEPLMRRPPVQIRQKIMQDELKDDFPYPAIFYVEYPPTEEKTETARREHWRGLVDFMAELEDWTPEEIDITKNGELPNWYVKRWSVPMSLWRP